MVKLITQTIKSKKYKVDSRLFDTFLYLNLHDVTVGEQSVDNSKKLKKDTSAMSKKERKRMKSVVKLQRELKEAEAVESKEKCTKLVKMFVICNHAYSNQLIGYIVRFSVMSCPGDLSHTRFTIGYSTVNIKYQFVFAKF